MRDADIKSSRDSLPTIFCTPFFVKKLDTRILRIMLGEYKENL